jgi:hypothetical protein
MLRPEEFKTFVENNAKKNGLDLDFDYDPGIGVFSIVFKNGIRTTGLTIPEERLDNRLIWSEVESEAEELGGM